MRQQGNSSEEPGVADVVSDPAATDAARPTERRRSWFRRHARAGLFVLVGAVVISVTWAIVQYRKRPEGWLDGFTVGQMEFRSFDRDTNLADVIITKTNDLVLLGRARGGEAASGYLLHYRGKGWVFVFDQSDNPLPITGTRIDPNRGSLGCIPTPDTKFIRVAIVAPPSEGPDAQGRAARFVSTAVRHPGSWEHTQGLLDIIRRLDRADDPVILQWLAWVVHPGAEQMHQSRGIPDSGQGGPPGEIQRMRADAAATACVVSDFGDDQQQLVRRMLQGKFSLESYTLATALALCEARGQAVPGRLRRIVRDAAQRWDDRALDRLFWALRSKRELWRPPGDELIALPWSTPGQGPPSDPFLVELAEMLPPKHTWRAIQGLHLSLHRADPKLIAVVRRRIKQLSEDPDADARQRGELFRYLQRHDPGAFAADLAAFGGPTPGGSNARSGEFASPQQQFLIEAIHRRDQNTLRRLLDQGVDPNQLDRGETPLDLAQRSGQREMVKLLQAHGAKTAREVRDTDINSKLPK